MKRQKCVKKDGQHKMVSNRLPCKLPDWPWIFSDCHISWSRCKADVSQNGIEEDCSLMDMLRAVSDLPVCRSMEQHHDHCRYSVFADWPSPSRCPLSLHSYCANRRLRDRSHWLEPHLNSKQDRQVSSNHRLIPKKRSAISFRSLCERHSPNECPTTISWRVVLVTCFCSTVRSVLIICFTKDRVEFSSSINRSTIDMWRINRRVMYSGKNLDHGKSIDITWMKDHRTSARFLDWIADEPDRWELRTTYPDWLTNHRDESFLG